MKTTLKKTDPESTEVATTNSGASETPVNWIRPEYQVQRLESGDYLLKVELPGVPKEGVNVSLEKDVLTIVGKRPDFHSDEWKPLFQEIPRGDYRLAITLNVKIDGERISAQVENGILTLDLRVMESAKPRAITIQ